MGVGGGREQAGVHGEGSRDRLWSGPMPVVPCEAQCVRPVCMDVHV